jgi:hypothetical protein
MRGKGGGVQRGGVLPRLGSFYITSEGWKVGSPGTETVDRCWIFNAPVSELKRNRGGRGGGRVTHIFGGEEEV